MARPLHAGVSGARGVRALLPELAVAGAAIATYLTALGNGFVSDAETLIPNNSALLRSDEWLAWFARPYFWGTPLQHLFLFRPLTVLSYVATIRLAGVEPLPFMVENVLLHAGASVLLLAVGRRLLGVQAALLGALLFAVHPLHSEAVAWIGGRTDLLATLFGLAAVLAFLRATERGVRRPAVHAGLAVTGYLAALLSKEHAITLPGWFALVGVVERGERSARSVALVLTGSLVAVLAYGLLHASAVGSFSRAPTFLASRLAVGGPGGEVYGGGLWPWLAGLAIAGRYAGLFLWPRRLTFDYTWYPAVWRESAEVPALEALGGGAVVVGLLAGLIWAFRAHRGLALALAFVPITYVVVSAFPFTPQLYIAERFTYLPSAGVCLAVGWLLLRIGEAAAGVARGPGPPAPAQEAAPGANDTAVPGWARTGWRGRAVAGLLVVLLAGLAARSAIRNPDWRTFATLAHAALAVSPRSPLALAMLGGKEYEQGNYDRARALMEQSMRLNPDRPEPYATLFNIYAKQGNIGKAIQLSHRAVAQLPRRQAGLAHNFAVRLWQAGRGEAAESVLRELVARQPEYFPSRVTLGRILLESGRPSEALEQFRVASRVNPESPWGWYGMARASWALGLPGDARAYADQARRVESTSSEESPRVWEGSTP